MKDHLPVSALVEYLSQYIPGLQGTPKVKQFRGGASNLTYLLKFKDQEVVLRKPPLGTKAKGAHDMHREYDVQKRLAGIYPVPKMLHYCADEELLGSDFYVMEKIIGNIPRKELPGSMSQDDVPGKICGAFLDHLVQLHSLDYKAAGFEQYYKGAGYVSRQVSGWIGRYRRAKTPDVPDWEYVMKWIEEQQPTDLPPAIIHNDFRFDNLVFDESAPQTINGVLDWEMATVGDPMMDLGNSLAYWIEGEDPAALQLMRRQPTHLSGMLSRSQLLRLYIEKMDLKVENPGFYYVFGLFRLAVIAQQIYYRYYHKQTTNKQFAIFGVAVNMLHSICRNLIRKNEPLQSGSSLSTLQNMGFVLKFMAKKITS